MPLLSSKAQISKPKGHLNLTLISSKLSHMMLMTLVMGYEYEIFNIKMDKIVLIKALVHDEHGPKLGDLFIYPIHGASR